MDDNVHSAETLLDRIDLDQDVSQIVQTISSILNAPDYQQLFSTFLVDATQPPPGNALKFVDALDKARLPSSNLFLSHTSHSSRL